MRFISLVAELRKRNSLLFYAGLLNLLGAIYCMVRYQQQPIVIVTGVNAWLKPIKFFLSIGILSFTMGWLCYYLKAQKKVRVYSWVLTITMVIEMGVIVWQAANGRISHFNIETSLYANLFKLMGVAIIVATGWTAYIGFLFFQQREFTISDTYLWGIRLGLLFFVVFSLEGGLMVARMQHSVGGPDGSPGVPLFNWSNFLGDLRVAHFFGMHSLQILPLVGRFLTNTKKQLFLFAGLYLVLVLVYLVQALMGIPAFY